MRAKLGQCFLIDKNIAKKIVNSAELTPKDTVIEIGPGKGILTEFILQGVNHALSEKVFRKSGVNHTLPKDERKGGVGKLICVEIDRELSKYLKQRFKDYKNIEIVGDTDFMNWEYAVNHIPDKTKQNITGGEVKYISNLPYYLTSPILEKVLLSKNWSLAVFMVQKEVADRILGEPGTKRYGALSLFVRFYSTAKKLFSVNRTCFRPSPEVDSVVLRFTKPEQVLASKNPKEFFKFVKSVFAYRRKTILNALSETFDIEKEYIFKILDKLSIAPKLRPESIEPQEFFRLYELISKK